MPLRRNVAGLYSDGPGYSGLFCVANVTMELLLNLMVSSIFAVRSRVILGTSRFPNGVVSFVLKRPVPLFI